MYNKHKIKQNTYNCKDNTHNFNNNTCTCIVMIYPSITKYDYLQY